MRIGAALIVSLLLTVPAIAENDGYRFTLDGEPVSPGIVSLRGTPERPAEGDVISLAYHRLVLGPPGEYRFRKRRNDLYLGQDIVALWNQKRLKSMSAKRIAMLRGIRLNRHAGDYIEKLAGADLDRLCVTVSGRGRVKLPAGLRVLVLDGWSPDSGADRAWLWGLRSLRVLLARRCFKLDLADLPRAPELRVLHAPYARCTDTKRLHALKEVRDLDLCRAKGLTEIEFARNMLNLVRLDISRTKVGDLTPVSGFLALRVIDARQSYVTKLPGGKLPDLVKLNALRGYLPGYPRGAPENQPDPVPDEAVTAFLSRNPDCLVVTRWDKPFRARLKAAKQLRVLARRPIEDRGKILISLDDEAEIARLLERLTIDDAHCGHTCYCGGDYILEFRRDEELLARISFHHGMRLRWDDGEWAGDARLSDEAEGFFAKWLEERGVKGPAEDRRRRWLQSLARDRRERQVEAVLGKAWYGAFTFEKEYPDPKDRAVVCLRLLGCHLDPWNRKYWLDADILMDVLPALPKEVVAAAVAKAGEDPLIAAGAARWLLGEKKPVSIEPNVLAVVGKAGLSHPRGLNRRLAMEGLFRIGGKTAASLFLDVLKGRITPRPLPEEDEIPPPLSLVAVPDWGAVPEECTDRAAAAWWLSKMKIRKALPTIRKLRETASEADRKLIDNGLNWFQ